MDAEYAAQLREMARVVVKSGAPGAQLVAKGFLELQASVQRHRLARYPEGYQVNEPTDLMLYEQAGLR